MRSPFLALIRKDLKGYFDQPTGYILLVIFVGAISYLFFFVSPFRNNAEASVRDLFNLLPWLLALFAPAATMRLLSEEQRDGTLELLLTHPIRGWTVLLAKFLSGLIFVGVAILATVGIPIALATAGNLDVGAVVAQYVGSLFLAAAFVSIGLFTSSITRNQIVAFILGLFVVAVLMLWGLDTVVDALPDRLAGLLKTLSPVTRFRSIARGVIDLRDVLYFIALVSTFLSATFLMVRARTLSHQSPQYRNLQLGVAGLMVLSLLVGWSGNSIGGRLDLTEDKLFTLSEGTEKILAGLDDLLTVTLYASNDPPPSIALVTRDVNDFLDDLAASSDGNVKIVRKYPDAEVDPETAVLDLTENEKAAVEARLAGIPAVPFEVRGESERGVKIGYLGIDMTYADTRQIVPFIRGVDGFEYLIASLAYRMTQRERKTVAFLTGSGQKSREQGLQTLSSLLERQFDVTEIEAIPDRSPDLSEVDVLIIAGPTQEIPGSVQEAVQAYLDDGGKAMILVDTVVIDQQRLLALPNRNSFADFVSRYGVIVEDDLVFDVESNEALPFTTQFGDVLLAFPYWMRVPVVDRKVAGDVDPVILPWASSIGIADSEMGPVEIVPLLETTPFAAIDFNYREVGPNSPAFQAVAQENRVQSIMGVAVASLEDASDGRGSFRLVVVGDSDWIGDAVVARAQENVLLGLNLIDWLAQEDALAAIRSKVVSSRQLLFSSSGHENAVRYANIIGVPLGLVVISLLLYVRRRSISARVYGS